MPPPGGEPLFPTSAPERVALTSSEMRQLAEFLAAEMRFQRARAFWEPVGWYRMQVDCTLAEAAVLRQMTVERCEAGPLRLWLLRSAALRSAGLDLLGLLAMGLFLILLCVAFSAPDDTELPDPAAAPAAQTLHAGGR